MSAGWVNLLGLVAGVCTTSSFVPQILKAWRAEGDTQAISKRTYVISILAFGLWIAHGLMIGILPLIVFNGLNLVFAGAILTLKLRDAAALTG
jgi:MtN3 and saliva related transmembrane protein